jgi:hypothetical protein
MPLNTVNGYIWRGALTVITQIVNAPAITPGSKYTAIWAIRDACHIDLPMPDVTAGPPDRSRSADDIFTDAYLTFYKALIEVVLQSFTSANLL